MKISDLIDSWKQDINIDLTDLANESIKIPKLHAKYYELFINENLLYSKLEKDYYKLRKIKTEYYTGRLDDDVLEKNKWEPFQLKVLKQDIDTYLQADDDIIKTLLNLSLQKEKVDFLKEIIKQLNTRTFLIKNALEFLRFSSGC